MENDFSLNNSLISDKQDELLLEKWRRAVPRSDKLLTSEAWVCELHFKDDEVERYYTHNLPDGNINKIERGRPLLKKNSIPSVFPNLPHYLSTNTKKRKLPKARGPLSEKKQKVSENVENIEGDIAVLPVPSEGNKDGSSEDNMLPDNFKILAENILLVIKPSAFWSVHTTEDFIIFAKWDSEFTAERRIVVTKDLHVKVFLKNKEIILQHPLSTDVENLSTLLCEVDKFVLCKGLERNAADCLGYVNYNEQLTARPRIVCENCFKTKPVPCNTLRNRKNCKVSRNQQWWRNSCINLAKRNLRMKRKIQTLKGKLQEIQKNCASTKLESIEKAISNFTLAQQEAVKACHMYSKLKDKRGMRYTTQWVYQCLLLRIKSKKAYNHLRSHQILALPSANTLCRYIRKVKGVYGFQKHIFDCLAKKSPSMNPCDRRGILLIDEMKVSSTLTFNPQKMEIEGFTDLGKYTPAHQKCEKGDHALVMMFQPFRGQWVQAVACFLSRGAASGTVLHHLITECIILLEKAGFNVDGVTSDGAAWNRNMWSKFGISEENVSCEHVFDSSRRLWFFSDFPHMIKNCRNTVTTKKRLQTPDGIIDLRSWKAVIELDNPKGFNLKVCPKLTESHVNPKHYQKMNVAMAFQFFSNSVASGMETYKTHHADLQNSDSCIKFIRRINSLIDVMNCRTSLNALKPNSEGEKVIRNFLEYLSEWEQLAKKEKSSFISDSTCYGLKITLKGTLELVQFLTEKCSFQYLMTGRLNQDSLERFFGLMRDACGSNDHPDSHVFIQLYRLMATYSLIKPPKGSNIAGGDILKTLITQTDMESNPNHKEEWEKKLDNIIDNGSSCEMIPEIIESFREHDYNIFVTPDEVISYFAGYIVRRCGRFSRCPNCVSSVHETEGVHKERNKLIHCKSYGSLLCGSDPLFSLLSVLENCVLEVVSSEPLRWNTLLIILSKLETGFAIPLIGCQEHQDTFTLAIVRFYLVTRMYFVCKQENRNDAAKVQKTKEHRKLSKF